MPVTTHGLASSYAVLASAFSGGWWSHDSDRGRDTEDRRSAAWPAHRTAAPGCGRRRRPRRRSRGWPPGDSAAVGW